MSFGRSRSRRRQIEHGVLVVALALTAHAAAAQNVLIQGTVRGDSGVVTTAAITVTPAGAGATASVTTRTNSAGKWSVAMPTRSADYFVTISAIGWTQARVVAHADSAGAPIVVATTLQRLPVQLAKVRVSAGRTAATRDGPVQPDVASTERGVLASSFAFAPGDQGNLAAMAAQVPGVTLIPSANGGPPGISMYGLSADQTRVTLNGLSTGTGTVPRDLLGLVRIQGASYDVSRGGASGAILSINQVPGQNTHSRLLHVSYDGPQLQATDAVGRQLGQQYRDVELSGNGAGPIRFDKLFYNVSFQGGRRDSDLRSLLSSDASTLQQLGVSLDSVTQLSQDALANGIPLTLGAPGGTRHNDNGTLLSRLDWTPDTNTNANIVASVHGTRSTASFITPTAVPGHGGNVDDAGYDLSADYSTLLHGTILSDWRLGAHDDNTTSTPYLSVPDARVVVSSTFADNTAGISSLAFGGNASLPRDLRTSGYELLQQTTWNSIGNAHRWRASLDARSDRQTQNDAFNTRGTFTYLSLADFEAGRPASFTRSFSSHGIAPEVETGSISLGDQWQRSQTLTFTYGARVDANRVTSAPAANPDVQSLFHVRTDYAPSEAVVSPRASFAWGVGHNGTTGIPGFGAPWGFLQGGIGEFRNDIQPGLVTPVLANTGLASGNQQITCVGGAVPAADWAAFLTNPESIPDACTAGATGAFSNGQPNVWLVSPGFQSQRSWRSNLTLRGPLFFKLIRFRADALYSLNLHQQGALDLNFSPTQQTTLASEGGRPLFTAASNVVPATGAMTYTDSRFTPTMGSVNAITSTCAAPRASTPSSSNRSAPRRRGWPGLPPTPTPTCAISLAASAAEPPLAIRAPSNGDARPPTPAMRSISTSIHGSAIFSRSRPPGAWCLARRLLRS